MASIPQVRPDGRATSFGRAWTGGPPRAVRRATAILASSVLALGLAAPAAFAQGFEITTPYPAIVVAPGAHVSFDVSVSTASPARVELQLTGAPEAWNASMHGGGFVIDAVETTGDEPAEVRVDLDVPADATGTTNMTLRGTEAGGGSVELVLSVRVDAEATGDVTITTDVPRVQGPASQTFNFNLTLSNDTAQDLTFSVNATGPEGWTVTAQLTGQSQAASAVVEAGSTAAVTVSAEAPEGVAAGTYDIQVVAVAGERNITGALQVDVTGSYTLNLNTPDGRLNGRGSAGSSTPLALTLENSGTAAITNVNLTATAPSGWEVTFDPATVASLEAGAAEPTAINAQIKPSGDAIAGDYTITIRAAGDQSTTDSIEIRYTVETSLLWGVIGVALILAVAAGIWFVFQRYGRR